MPADSIRFGQIYGMCDHITFHLGETNFTLHIIEIVVRIQTVICISCSTRKQPLAKIPVVMNTKTQILTILFRTMWRTSLQEYALWSNRTSHIISRPKGCGEQGSVGEGQEGKTTSSQRVEA